MNIRDKAQGGGPEVVRASSLRTEPPRQIAEAQLYEADELTPDGQFPEYGEFLRMTEPEPADDTEVYWECPVGLATGLTDIVDEKGIEMVGAFVDVVSAHKSADGNWKFQLDVQADRDELMG